MIRDCDRVLGNFDEEMQRRREAGQRSRRKDMLGMAGAFVLVAFGIWPLGIWNVLAVLAGLLWIGAVSEGPANRVADELDLLEQKIVARIGQSKARG